MAPDEVAFQEARILERIGQGDAIEEMTLSAWIERCCRRWEGRKAVSTVQHYRDQQRLWVAPTIGRVRLTALTTPQVQAWIDHLEELGYAPATIRLAKALVSMALREAAQRGIVSHNVCQAVETPPVRRYVAQVWTRDEVERVLAHVRGDPRLQALYVLALNTGMRSGELRALGWEHVDLDAGLIHVVRTVTRGVGVGVGEVIGATTKTGQGRVIPVADAVVAALRWHRTQQVARRLAAPVWQDTGLVFDSGAGRMWSNTGFRDRHRAVCVAAGVPVIRVHDMRHTVGTLLYEEDEQVKTVSGYLGHRDVRTTMNIYQHMGERVQRRVSQRLADLVMGTPEDAEHDNIEHA